MKRTFFAIKIPLTKNISEIYQRLKVELKDEKVKWVEEWNLHITILFLGDTDENDIGKICDEFLLSLKEFNSFLLTVAGIGVFKSVYNPKAIWLGVKKSKDLNELYELISDMFISRSSEVQKKIFKPHITIGRTKLIKNKNNLKKLIEDFNEKEIDQIKINEIYYYESILTSKGPVYNVIRKFNLV
ncbi:MAG: RNA 2',3'-cyclic phosphodiesterase [Bacteroidales bacterium]|nr:RNA 2',3'-cyclic phosphodiesterase [Bacteroidales bacterium]